jgi:hypothetical protein
MGVVVMPSNLNNRQRDRVMKIRKTDKERAMKVADKISDRRANRGIGESAKKIKAEVKAKADEMKNQSAMKNGGMKKAKNGKEFGMLSVKAGIDKNPNPTFADKIAGAKKKAMSGMEMMKMGGKAAKQAAIAIAMKKAGKTPKKKMMKNGGTLSAPKKDGLSMQLGSYKDIIGKNYKGKNTKAVGLTKAKYGKSVMKMGGKCKNGC